MMPSIIESSSSLSPLSPHWLLYPRTYVAPRIDASSSPVKIDGDLTKDVWSNAKWSELFDDIRGPTDAPDSERPPPTCRTRFKMMWDDQYLYIGAEITSDFTTEAHFTKRNSPIFQKDSDFEVFIDPNGSCHHYKELELNAINTVWNLMLDKPYGDGGAEHSGRIARPGDPFYYEVQKQKSATKVLEGSLNDPSMGATYSVEIAMAHSDTLAHLPANNAKVQPSVGRHWRINFSRVEKKGDINWTWQPQIIWDAERKRFGGFVNMHLPDAWGYVVFGDAEGSTGVRTDSDKALLVSNNSNDNDSPSTTSTTTKIPRDPSWPKRLAAMNIYYAQQYFKTVNGDEKYASNVDQLLPYLDQSIVAPFDIQIRSEKEAHFVATVKDKMDAMVVKVTDDRLVTVEFEPPYSASIPMPDDLMNNQ